MKLKRIIVTYIFLSGLLIMLPAFDLSADDMKVEQKSQATVAQQDKGSYAGVQGLVLETTFSEPAQYFLVPFAAKLPVKILKSQEDFSRIPLHTDLKILFAVATKDGVLVRCQGAAAYNTIPFSDTMTEMGGYPGTRLDLTDMGVPMIFLGKKWAPKAAGKPCIMQIAKERIEVFGCNIGKIK